MPGNTVNECPFSGGVQTFPTNRSMVNLDGYADFDASNDGLKVFHDLLESPDYRSDTFPAFRFRNE